MLSLLVAVFALCKAIYAQTPTETAPLIINQGPTNRCWSWYAEPSDYGSPPDKETNCYGDNMYGRFNLATYGWRYPNDYQKSPGYDGSVTGANGSPLTISLTNNAKNANCTGVEINLSYDYPTAALYANVSDTDLSQYDSVIIEYDAYVKSATISQSECSCLENGKASCPSWWKSQFTTDILFYQGPNKDFNVISVRNFDPQNNGNSYFNAAGGHRYQYSDHQIQPVSGTRAHVRLDAKHLIASYSSQLCQGGSTNGPIFLRSIQFVSIATGADMTVEIQNVKANAFKYKPGTFTSSAVPPGCTPTNCPSQPSDPKSSCASWVPQATGAPTSSNKLYDQCGGKTWTGSTSCPSGAACKIQNEYYSQCLPV
ncbi:3-oxo-5-alpha-steroid 4-dehydrogenase protein [Pochonia chlamydosporia 170]|uniref:3-oxo-5-alpha-steroid 4-dehydrogenase protein n=1 Tax=Pochonia chlamydosporia 170 TaxID=1380566 RepID=A0A179F402_METCM|nr:3-oxo-5-alpha-steroid 4-dehydrogenase protein [Pochonia chlamydosporia 170]OAQ60135.1 3-oxo-5-alpha-steroid 4-dehydrogenase protein [Pochonia chlamydosporia 170]